ncbi:Argininosuccinate lyase [Variovorax sp. PBS-H4]|uniref:tripartite tricarboxylate transporter substrate binding protein n=1 Tax=Variovorax sp. PBS-H4 TaxID=434008 RepID=UPI0013180A76|nr:tripartite tricarboxylate transporter substrate binding protein [Variovorax sp. PBS-H4]VTU28615.1 Argininosuccinate lyase [Variovorax sp. PBS-H4]
MKRRVFFSGCRDFALAAAVAAAGTLAAAQPAFPSRPIKLIVPTNPGGSIDTIARVLGEELSKELKQPVIVENKTGAGGMIAATAVSQSAPDGYTLLVTHTGVLQADLLRAKSSYRLSDLTPVAEVSNTPVAFGVGANVPVTDLKSFIALAKAEPGKLSYGSYGKGTSAHIWAEQFSQHAGIKLVHVPYGGEIPAMQDVLAGHITSGWGAVGTYKQQADTHKIRILAVANPVRSVLLPDVPTFIEAGFPEMNASGWCGVFASAATPKAVVAQLSQLIVKTVQRQDVAARILATGQEPTGADEAAFGQRVARDRKTWAKAIADFNITLD